MKKLTKKRRRKIYMKAAVYFSTPNALEGCCYCLLQYAGMHGIHSREAVNVFPEFALFEPDKKRSPTLLVWCRPRRRKKGIGNATMR